MTVTTRYFPLKGGLDLSTPSLSVKPGTLLAGINFVSALTGGYKLFGGYERVDGRIAPSASQYYVLEVADTSTFSVGATTGVGATSGAAATVIYIDATKNWLVITKLTNAPFIAAETLGATTVTTPEVLNGSATSTEEGIFKLAAEDEYRADILVVPGSGVMRGVWRNNTRLYAFRDNAGATAVDVFKATVGGWSQVVISSHTLRFSGGGGGTGLVLAEGDTLDGVTSGAAGLVHKMVLHAGGFSTNDAVGYVVLTGVTGGPFTNTERLDVGGVKVADAASASSIVAFSNGGNFRFINRNFYGTSITYNVYGCNGVDPAFEIDESDVFSPVLMPTNISGVPANNTPFLIEEHRGHLFLAFENGSLQHSAPGTPLVWNGFLGAAEFGLGQDIMDIRSISGPVLSIWTSRKTHGLYGSGVSDWELKTISEESGALLHSANTLGYTYAWDDKGITRLDRVQAFGDFEAGTVSRSIQGMLSTIKSTYVDSTVVRSSNTILYTLSTGELLAAYIPEKGVPEYSFLKFPVVVSTINNVDDELGLEHVYFGADDGYVYEFTKDGTSFDGVAKTFSLRTTYNHFKSPRMRKTFKHANIELFSELGVIDFEIAGLIDYSGSNLAPGLSKDVNTLGASGFWGDALWNQFFWSTQEVPTDHVDLAGTGVNLAFLITGSSNVVPPFTVQGAMVHFINRRLDRG